MTTVWMTGEGSSVCGEVGGRQVLMGNPLCRLKNSERKLMTQIPNQDLAALESEFLYGCHSFKRYAF